MKIEVSPIGYIKSPFKDKFGVPRQASLINEAFGVIVLNEDPVLETAIQGLESFSHLWILFVFHEHGGKRWKPSIRPPRLGGAQKVGVLASRSPHRPNPIGMSAVKISKIERVEKSAKKTAENKQAKGAGAPRSKKAQQIHIHVQGIDLIDGTPVIDIKPYIPYADAIPGANSGWASEEIPRHPVLFSEASQQFLKTQAPPGLREMIIQVMEIDPRPAYMQRKSPISSQKSVGLKYGIEISGHEVKYEITDRGFLITQIFG